MALMVHLSIDRASSKQLLPANSVRLSSSVVAQKAKAVDGEAAAVLGVVGDDPLDNHEAFEATSVEATAGNPNVPLENIFRLFGFIGRKI